jgi:hypothetical protein
LRVLSSRAQVFTPEKQACCKGTGVLERKKEQGGKPCSKNCVDPISPKNLDLILIAGLTLLVRARAPPETWTTRLQPSGQPEPALLDHLFRLVTIFGSDWSKFEQFAKWLRFRHSGLHLDRSNRPRREAVRENADRRHHPDRWVFTNGIIGFHNCTLSNTAPVMGEGLLDTSFPA